MHAHTRTHTHTHTIVLYFTLSSVPTDGRPYVGDAATSSSSLPSDEPEYQLRLCHVTEWPDFPGFGFNVQTLRDKPGQYVGGVDADSPAAAAGQLHRIREYE